MSRKCKAANIPDYAADVPTSTPDALPNFEEIRIALRAQTVSNPCFSASEPVFVAADLSALKLDPENFFEDSYCLRLQAMVDAIIERQAPLREATLAQRIARAHGWPRIGARICEQIARHLRNLERTKHVARSRNVAFAAACGLAG